MSDNYGYRIVYSFGPNDVTSDPETPVTLDPLGNILGSTYFGGLFKVNTNGDEVFNVQSTAGVASAIVADPSGSFYFTTSTGGQYGQGTVSKLDGNGKQSIVHSFTYGGMVFAPCRRWSATVTVTSTERRNKAESTV